VTAPEERNPWEVLGVRRGASENEVRRAYERLSAALAPGSLALYSLAEDEGQRALQEELRTAYLTLMRAFGWDVPSLAEPEPRVAQEVAERPAGEAAPPPPVEPPPAAQPSEFGGAELRRIREGMGLSVAEIAERTRIRPRQIESLEGERFAELPQRVFVRGFVMAVARELHLDPDRVWASYGTRWERSTGQA
jgi:hypothetical protein